MKVAAQILAHALESMERHGVCKQVRSLVAFDVGHAAGIDDDDAQALAENPLSVYDRVKNVVHETTLLLDASCTMRIV